MENSSFNNFSNKIKWFNLFFTITVVAKHCVRIWEMYCGVSNSVISDFYIELEQNAMTFFFLMSGFWFFINYTKSGYLEKIQKKVHSIIIPYILWGGLKIIVVQLWSLISTKQLKYSLPECIINLLFIRVGTISFDPLNGPLWYLIRIMSYFIVAPILYCLIKNEFIGIISLFVLKAISSSCGYYTFGGWLFVFCLGGYIGLHYSDQIINMANRIKGISIPFALMLYSLFVHFNSDINLLLPIDINDSIFSIIIILCLIIFSESPSCEMRHSNYSFLLYCSHVIWITFLVKIVHTLLGNIINSGICQSMVLLMCCIFVAFLYFLLKKFMPNLFRILVGGRNL